MTRSGHFSFDRFCTDFCPRKVVEKSAEAKLVQKRSCEFDREGVLFLVFLSCSYWPPLQFNWFFILYTLLLSLRAPLHMVGHVAVYVFDINQPSLPTPFYSVPVSISVSMALSTVFHSINSPDNSPLSHSVLPVLFLPYWFFQLYIISLWKSPSALIYSFVVDWA